MFKNYKDADFCFVEHRYRESVCAYFSDSYGGVDLDWLREFEPNSELIVFFKPHDRENVFKISKGGLGLFNILQECYRFDFYVTTTEFKYVIAVYDDCIHATGVVIPWFEYLAKKTNGDLHYSEDVDPPTIEEMKHMYPSAFKLFKDKT